VTEYDRRVLYYFRKGALAGSDPKTGKDVARSMIMNEGLPPNPTDETVRAMSELLRGICVMHGCRFHGTIVEDTFDELVAEARRKVS